MKLEEIQKIYDEKYSKDYDERFLLSDYSKVSSSFEVEVINKCIEEINSSQSSWLDIACGTGYYLSLFDNIEKVGIDISKNMLEIAKKRNPNATFINGDLLCVLNEIDKQFDLITCMWTPYNYLNSMNDFDLFLELAIDKINPGGFFFLPIFDLEDIRPHTKLEYIWETSHPNYEGQIILTSSTWTWVEKNNGKVHKHLIAPQVEYIVEKVSRKFEEIQVLRYPTYKDGWVSRKGVLMKKKSSFDTNAKIIFEPNPSLKIESSNNLNNLDRVSSFEIVKYLLKRICKNGK